MWFFYFLTAESGHFTSNKKCGRQKIKSFHLSNWLEKMWLYFTCCLLVLREKMYWVYGSTFMKFTSCMNTAFEISGRVCRSKPTALVLNISRMSAAHTYFETSSIGGKFQKMNFFLLLVSQNDKITPYLPPLLSASITLHVDVLSIIFLHW